MTIDPGTVLPEAVAKHGERTPLRLFYFMRTADCPVCRQHVKRLAALHGELSRRGASIVVFAPEDEGRPVPAYVSALPFPFVPSQAAYAAVGFDRVLGALQQSGTLVADQAGTLLFVRQATLPFKAFPEAEILALVRQRGGSPSTTGNLSLA